MTRRRTAHTKTYRATRDALYARITKAAGKDHLYVFLLRAEDLYGRSAPWRWHPRMDGKLIVKDLQVAG